jgi:hypothetical protein
MEEYGINRLPVVTGDSGNTLESLQQQMPSR